VNNHGDSSAGAEAPRGKTTTTTPHVGASGDQYVDKCVVSNDTTIQEELEDLRKARERARRDRESAEGVYVNTEARLAVLDGVERDYPTTKKTYDDAYPQLRRDHDNLTDYLDCEESNLKTRLGAAAAQVDRLVEDRDKKSRQLERAFVKATKDVQQTSAPLEAFNEAIKKRTAELNAWKNLTATVTAQHTELKKFRDDINKARDGGDYALAYGLLVMAKSKRQKHKGGPHLVEPSEVHQEFHVAGEKLVKAQRELASAQRDLEVRKAVLAAVTKDLDEHRKTSEARLRVELVGIKPADDGASSAGAGGTSHDSAGSSQDDGGSSRDGGGSSPDDDAAAADINMKEGNGHA
jgi:chromosome segregation ATPase